MRDAQAVGDLGTGEQDDFLVHALLIERYETGVCGEPGTELEVKVST